MRVFAGVLGVMLYCLSVSAERGIIPQKRRSTDLCWIGRKKPKAVKKKKDVIASPRINIGQEVTIKDSTLKGKITLGPNPEENKKVNVVIKINYSELEGEVDITGNSTLDWVDAKGLVKIDSTRLNIVELNSSSIAGAPGIIIKHTECVTNQELLNISHAGFFGDVEMKTCGKQNDFSIDGHVEISGRVTLGYADIDTFPFDAADPKPTSVKGNRNDGIALVGGTLLCDSSMSGDIFVVDSFVGIGGTYDGSLMASEMKYAFFDGINDFKGHFNIDGVDMEDVEIDGQPFCDYGGLCHGVVVSAGAVVGKGATLIGRVGLSGTIGPGTTVHGEAKSPADTHFGINMLSGVTFTGAGKTLRGNIRLEGNKTISDSDVYGHNGSIVNSSVSGTNINVDGQFWLKDATLSGGRLDLGLEICGAWPVDHVFIQSNSGVNCTKNSSRL